MTDAPSSWLARMLRFCLENKLVVGLLFVAVTTWGALVAPFADFDLEGLPRDPVPVDAIPDTGENQQIVFTRWPGRSPQDVEDQVTYPLTVALLGVPGVKTVRSSSMIGFSSIYVIFEDDIDFYWSRSRLLEKLASLPTDALPDGVQPALGPDATALGQVFWYTLEGRDEHGDAAGGWDLHELRSVQDWQVRYALAGVEGVAEVASIGGYVQEYQIDVDPDAMRAHGVTLEQVFRAVRMANAEVGARTIEINRAEYVVRGIGFLQNVADIERTVVTARGDTPLLIGNVADVHLGPALRRGALDRAGTEAVGGVVVVRYGANPLQVIEAVKRRIEQIEPGLPKKTLDDGRTSKVTIVPFYDRSGLIQETLGTLSNALRDEILVTILVVLLMVGHLRSAGLISGLLPLSVLMCFIAMKHFGVDANVVALSGIAIAIGTMVDMGVVICENILRHIDPDDSARQRLDAIWRASTEVGSAVLTAVLTTVISFLPVFTMEGAEGKLFRPLAFTKTFALLASIVVALAIIPPLAHLLLPARRRSDGRGRLLRHGLLALLLVVGVLLGYYLSWTAAAVVWAVVAHRLLEPKLPPLAKRLLQWSVTAAIVVVTTLLLASTWAPLGPERPAMNALLTTTLLGGFLLLFKLLLWGYEPMLRFCLRFKLLFLMLPAGLCLLGSTIWLGFPRVFGWLPDSVRLSRPAVTLAHAFPGLGQEFMPRLDEGSFLLMPVTMVHASIGEALDMLQQQDRRIQAIPEVETVVGKIGRVESPLDPAPVSMVETVVQYRSEYVTDAQGNPRRFAYDDVHERFVRDADGELVADPDGRPFRQWRDQIRSPDDIWQEVATAAAMPGMTVASKDQPINVRQTMLQSGLRMAFGIKIHGPDLETIEAFGLELEKVLQNVPGVDAAKVFADRIIGKPYLEIVVDRDAIARHGLHVQNVQSVIEVAIGGRPITRTVEGRERYPVRIRYRRELRDRVDELERILIAAPDGTQVPLGQLAEIVYTPGPQVIKSEDTFLTGHVLFDKLPGFAEVEVVDNCRRVIDERIESGALVIPEGVSYRFAGQYENQVRATERLRIVLPLALLAIFLILYLQFRRVSTTLLVFSGVFVAWSGGFLMLWLYGQDWFLDFDAFGHDVRALFQVGTVNLSVAVWVGFLALFGIATDDGVLMSTYLQQSFAQRRPTSVAEIREAVVQAGLRRIRPCLMTTATTVLALLPVLTSTGRGSDVMVPMAIPSFGGMLVAIVTIFVVPVLYAMIQEWRLRLGGDPTPPPDAVTEPPSLP